MMDAKCQRTSLIGWLTQNRPGGLLGWPPFQCACAVLGFVSTLSLRGTAARSAAPV